jgi:hypothetical protein
MSASRRNSSSHHSDNCRWNDIPGIGRVPNRPRALHHSREYQYGRPTLSQRNGIRWRGEHSLGARPSGRSPSPLFASRQPDRRFSSTTHLLRIDTLGQHTHGLAGHSASTDALEYGQGTSGSITLSGQNPSHFLTRVFGRRKEELRQEAEQTRAARRALPFQAGSPHRKSDRPSPVSANDVAQTAQSTQSQYAAPKDEPLEEGEITSVIDPHSRPQSPSQGPPSAGNEKGVCVCPIRTKCRARADNLIDCRTLVSEYEWKGWQKRFQDDYKLPYADCLAV